MDVPSATLRVMFDKLLVEVERSAIHSLDHDYYWNMGAEERVDMQHPASPTVGSLQDDWAELTRRLHANEMFTPVDVERFGNILIAISEKMSNG
ncbi:MAG: hypothetical protein OXT67_09725 [Zetaproteobacteria bacterium]|nr:hypothetical protein [Zetaproteobacteria bacterium]